MFCILPVLFICLSIGPAAINVMNNYIRGRSEPRTPGPLHGPHPHRQDPSAPRAEGVRHVLPIIPPQFKRRIRAENEQKTCSLGSLGTGCGKQRNF